MQNTARSRLGGVAYQSYRSFMVTIRVTPERPALDTELRVRLAGLPPGQGVTVRAESSDPAGRSWISAATFTADRDGLVDLTRDAPVSGSYQQADAMGLIWSMRPAGSADPALARSRYAPVPLRLITEADGMAPAIAEIWRDVIPGSVIRTELPRDGLVGVLFHPQGAGPWPAVMQLGGAEGGLHEDDAALLAAHGHTVLALAYYGLPGLPPVLTGCRAHAGHQPVRDRWVAAGYPRHPGAQLDLPEPGPAVPAERGDRPDEGSGSGRRPGPARLGVPRPRRRTRAE
jgi:hypothetical protein